MLRLNATLVHWTLADRIFEARLAEILKYYTLTGLGGVYVLGPKRIIAMGITNPKDAILDAQGKVIQSWEDLNQKFS